MLTCSATIRSERIARHHLREKGCKRRRPRFPLAWAMALLIALIWVLTTPPGAMAGMDHILDDGRGQRVFGPGLKGSGEWRKTLDITFDITSLPDYLFPDRISRQSLGVDAKVGFLDPHLHRCQKAVHQTAVFPVSPAFFIRFGVQLL